MGETFEVIKGRKIEPAEAARLDRREMGVALNTPPKAEGVEGQRRFPPQLLECPWCGNFMWPPREIYLWITCVHCGGAFKA